jgi:hypothetical protein
MAIMNEDMSVVMFLMRRFRSQKTYDGIRQVAEENHGYASLYSVLDPILNRIPVSPEDQCEQAFDEVVLSLLKEACPKLMFICRNLVNLHRVTVNLDGTASNNDYSMVVSKNNGNILFYVKDGRYVHATLDVDSCLSQIAIRGFPVEWI